MPDAQWLTTMMQMQIAAVIAPQRDRLDACLIFPSMPAVLRLNKLGSFDFAKLMGGGGGKGGVKKDSPIKKFFGTLKKNNDNFEEQLLKLIRTLPAVLKFLPSQQARDGGNYIQSLQYWLGGNAENLENLVLSTAQAYVPALKGVDFGCEGPQLFPEVGIWHPLAPGRRFRRPQFGQKIQSAAASSTLSLGQHLVQRDYILLPVCLCSSACMQGVCRKACKKRPVCGSAASTDASDFSTSVLLQLL